MFLDIEKLCVCDLNNYCETGFYFRNWQILIEHGNKGKALFFILLLFIILDALLPLEKYDESMSYEVIGECSTSDFLIPIVNLKN